MENARKETSLSQNVGFNVSSAYVPINTAIVVEQFNDAGFTLTDVKHARVRNAAKNGFQKHLLVFQHKSLQFKGVNDSVPQILLKNSYDGTTSFQVFLGIYRLVCSNGLVVGSTYESIKVRHIGENALPKAIEGALHVAEQANKIADQVQRMQSKQLTGMQAYDFAQMASSLILPDTAVHAEPTSLLKTRRQDDTGNDLWTILNLVQENIVRGGLKYTSVNNAGRARRNTARAIKAIDRNIEVNQALWDLAEKLLDDVA